MVKLEERSHRMGVVVVCLLCFLFVSSSCCMSVVADTNENGSVDEWTMFGYDSGHSSYTTDNCSAGSSKLLWKYRMSERVFSSPAVFNGCVFVASLDGQVCCLNASDGELVWNYTFEQGVGSSPAVYNGHVYFGADNGNVYCFDAATGALVWNSSIGGLVRSSPAVVDDRVYVGSGAHDVFCLNASDGTVIWRCPTPSVFSSPAVSDGVVYVSVDDYFVWGINASTGNKIWSTQTSSCISSPTIHNGYVYIGSLDGYVFCLNASNGATVWEYRTKNSVSSSPAVAYGRVYVGSEDNNVYCLNASNGEKLWHSSTGYWVCSSPAVADGKVYVGSEDYGIHCFDAFTGAKKWSYETGNFVDSSPAIADGKLFVGSNDCYVYAFVLGDSADELPTPSNSLHLSTIVFDALACTVFAAAIFVVVRSFRLSRQTEQNVEESFDQKFGWLLKHIDYVYVLGILVFSTMFFVDLDALPLWVSDEKIYSQAAFYMVKSGDYLTPWAFGRQSLYIAKPPLFLWLMSLSYQLFGANNLGTRFWSAVFATLLLVLIFYLGKNLYNRHVGFLSALVLGTFFTFNIFAKRGMTDVTLIFFLVASIYFLFLSEKQDKPDRYVALGGLFFALAFMTKQIAALLIPAILFVYYIATGKGFLFLFTKRFKRFWQVGLLVILPWLVYMLLRFGSDFVYYFFVFSGANRIATAIEGHLGSYLYYFTFLASEENLLWITLLPFAVGLCMFNSVVKRSKKDTLVLVWMVVVFGVFTVSQTKIEWYILPAFPAFAIAISRFLYWLPQKLLRRQNPPQENESKSN